MTRIVPPDRRLAACVAGYWFVQDLPGRWQGSPIRTFPQPGAVLSVNFGRPNAMVDGPLVPRASLLGIQSASRSWRSWENTWFVMAMLTAEGMVRLFPRAGDSADRLLDLGALIGDGPADRLCRHLDGGWEPARIACALDHWLLARLGAVAAVPELARMSAAHRMLREGGSVEAAAAAAGVTRRQLGRWYRAHFGPGPKQMMDLERLQASLRAAQSGRGDPVTGFADQAHQIRNWRRRLGTTPGRYLRSGMSDLAGLYAAPGEGAPVFYL